MSAPVTISADMARLHLATLDLLLAAPGIDADTERRAKWLRMRLVEIAGATELSFDLIEARIAELLPAEAAHRLVPHERPRATSAGR